MVAILCPGEACKVIFSVAWHPRGCGLWPMRFFTVLFCSLHKTGRFFDVSKHNTDWIYLTLDLSHISTVIVLFSIPSTVVKMLVRLALVGHENTTPHGNCLFKSLILAIDRQFDRGKKTCEAGSSQTTTILLSRLFTSSPSSIQKLWSMHSRHRFHHAQRLMNVPFSFPKGSSKT